MKFLTFLKGSGDSSRSSRMYAALLSPIPCAETLGFMTYMYKTKTKFLIVNKVYPYPFQLIPVNKTKQKRKISVGHVFICMNICIRKDGEIKKVFALAQYNH